MNNNHHKLLMLFFAIILTSCSPSEDEQVLENSQLTVAEISNKAIEVDILNLINDYRAGKGLSRLSRLSIIKTQTSAHNSYMISRGEISHDNFHQRKEYLINNADAISVGENVAYGYTSAQSVVDAWIRSDGHRENIEGDFTHFEVSADENSRGSWYYTNIFVKK